MSSKFIARTFDSPVEFDNYVQSLDANNTEIISISKFYINRVIGSQYSIVIKVEDTNE